MVSNYQRGYETERKAFKELENEGYTVTRASGSHTCFDIIAYNHITVRFIQCKRVKGKYYSFKHDIRRMEDTPIPSNCTMELWIWLDRMKGRKAKWEKRIIE